MYLFMFVDFLKSFCQTQNPIAVIKINEYRKVLPKGSFLMPSTLFVINFFLNLLLLPVFFVLYGAVNCRNGLISLQLIED